MRSSAPQGMADSRLSDSVTATNTTTQSPVPQALAALVLGSVVLFGVGFLPMDAAHNAAHDSRHSHAFPCH